MAPKSVGPLPPNILSIIMEATAGLSRVRRPAVVSSRFKPNIPEPGDRRANLRQERYAAAPTTAFYEWFADLRRAHTPFDEPPSAADDH